METEVLKPCYDCARFELRAFDYEKQIKQLEFALENLKQQEEQTLDNMKNEWRRDKHRLVTLARSAEDQRFLAQCRYGSLEERLETAENANILLSVEVSDLNAMVIQLNAIIDAQSEEMRILRSPPVPTLDTAEDSANHLHGVFHPGRETDHGDTSSQASDVDVLDFPDSSFECDSAFSDMGALVPEPGDSISPEYDYAMLLNGMGTPAMGSPTRPSPPPTTSPSVSGDWSEIEADSDMEHNSDDLDSFPTPSPSVDVGVHHSAALAPITSNLIPSGLDPLEEEARPDHIAISNLKESGTAL